MNTRKLKSDLKRLRTASRYDERRYELAAARQLARWEVLWDERFTLPNSELHLDYAKIDGTPTPEPDDEELVRVAAARSLLEMDSDERCARDQEIVETYHLRRHGHLKYAPVPGGTRDELWTNHLNCLFGPGSRACDEYEKWRTAQGFPPLPEPGSALPVAQAYPDTETGES